MTKNNAHDMPLPPMEGDVQVKPGVNNLKKSLFNNACRVPLDFRVALNWWEEQQNANGNNNSPRQ